MLEETVEPPAFFLFGLYLLGPFSLLLMKNLLAFFVLFVTLTVGSQTMITPYGPTSGGFMNVASDVWQRPNDTTAYQANDAIGASTNYTDTNVLRGLTVARGVGGSGYITSLRVWTEKASVTPRIRVHFYNVAAPVAPIPGDNWPMTIVFTNAQYRIGSYDLPAMTSGQAASGSYAASDASTTHDMTSRMPFVCAANDNKLYYRLETLDAFTPGATNKWFISVCVDQN